MGQTTVGAQVHVYPTAEAVAEHAAQTVAQTIASVMSSTGRFTIALSGGETPRLLYGVLARQYRDSLPWAKVHFFWGDGRFVPQDSPSSNYRMVKEALLDHVPLQQINVHPMPVFFHDPVAAAADYEATLKAYWADTWPRFDLMLLGLGADCHTASLFPHAPALNERTRWVVAVEEQQAEPPQRLTVTLPVINHAARVHFIVTGADKAEAVARVLSGAADPASCPAAGVQLERGEVAWWLDEAAAAGITSADTA